MPRILLIGSHAAFRRDLEASGALTGCEFVSASGNVDAVRRARARAIVHYFRDPGSGFTPAQLERSALSNSEADPIAHLERRAEMGLRPGG